MDRSVAGHTSDTVVGVQVLVQRELEHGSTSLSASDGAVSQEEHPDPVPAITILGNDVLLVADPVQVPSVDSRRVVDAQNVDVLDLKACALQLANNPAKRARSISTREDIFVHEKSPDKILILPTWADTCNLEDKNTVVVKEIIDLAQELRVSTDADVLSHFQTNDLVVCSAGRDLTIIAAQNTGTVSRHPVLGNSFCAKLGLILSERNTSGVASEVLGGVRNERSPSTANIKQGVSFLEVQFATHDGKLIVLKSLQGFIGVSIQNNAGGVDHAWAKEPRVEVVTTVIMASNLFLVLGLRVDNDLRNKDGKHVFEQLQREGHFGPVMALLKHVQDVAIEINFALEIRVVEDLHGDFLLALVQLLELGVVDSDVLVNILARQLNLFVFPAPVNAHERPVADSRGCTK